MTTLTLAPAARSRVAARLGLRPQPTPPPQPDQSIELLSRLRRIAPAAFRDPPPPLAIGTRGDIVARFGGRFSRRDVARALGRWCGRSDYLRALAAGSVRVGLNGSPAGIVTENEAAHAADRLARRGGRRAL